MVPPFEVESGASARLPRARGWRIGAVAVAAGAAAWVRWRPFRVAVVGSSMSPTLEPGDWLVAVRPGRLSRGSVVVIEHPERPGFELVKRLTGLPGDTMGALLLEENHYWVTGDGPDASTDSRWFGPVPARSIRAVVAFTFWPPGRMGRPRPRPDPDAPR